MEKFISIINGPNLNILSKREPEIYGTTTLAEIIDKLKEKAQIAGFSIQAFQSNSEGAIVDEIQRVSELCCGIIINPAAYTHTSVAIRDALSAVKVPVIEVHISNVFSREEFRRHSYISPVASAVISGFGSRGYYLALDGLVDLTRSQDH